VGWIQLNKGCSSWLTHVISRASNENSFSQEMDPGVNLLHNRTPENRLEYPRCGSLKKRAHPLVMAASGWAHFNFDDSNVKPKCSTNIVLFTYCAVPCTIKMRQAWGIVVASRSSFQVNFWAKSMEFDRESGRKHGADTELRLYSRLVRSNSPKNIKISQ
jgi:hypothetical protein